MSEINSITHLTGITPRIYGRPMEQKPIRFELRLSAEKWRQIDDWRRQLPSPPSKTVAVRLLIDTALATPAARQLLERSSHHRA